MPVIPLAEWGFLAGVTLLAAAVQSATGFGFAILAVPLYLLILNSLSAVQVAIVVTPVISVAVLPRLWPRVRRELLGRLMAGSLLGLPLGMAVFLYAGLFWIKVTVAVLIVLFALLFLLHGRGAPREGGAEATPRPRGAARELAVGLVSGAMTASLGMPGPSVMLYFSALNLERDVVRATLLSLFVFSYASAAGVQAAVAGIAGSTWLLAGAMAPCALAGAALGHALSRGMSQRVFRISALLLLIGTGLYMLYGTLAGS